MTAAAFTMVWNEAERLPRWIAYYGAELGRRNLFVLDDGSDDGSTDALGAVNVVRLPRNPAFDEGVRARRLSDFAAELLGRFDWVLFSDVDEFVVPFGGGPLARAIDAAPAPTVTTLGFDVMHRPSREAALAADTPIMAQRRHARFNATYCKPLLTRMPVAWRPGFHFSDRPTVVGDLLLLHMRYADLDGGLRRLRQSRQVTMANAAQNWHWKAQDEEFRATLQAAEQASYGELERRDIDAWGRRVEARLAGRPANAVERIRDLPDLHPSWYRLSDAYARVG